MKTSLPWCIGWMMIAACCFLGSAAVETEQEELSLAQLFEKVAAAKGEEYFALKGEYMKQEGALEKARELEADPEATWQQRVVVAAVREEMEDPGNYQALLRKLASQGAGLRWGLMKRALPPDVRAMAFGNPKALPADSEAGEFFRSLRGSIGLLAEVILKHNADTLGVVAAESRAEGLKRLDEQRRQGKLIDRDFRPKVLTPEQILKQWGQKEWLNIVRDTRLLAYRALVVVGTDDAVRILEPEARRSRQGGPAVGPDYLGWIGTDAAIEALERIGTPEAVETARVLEARKKRQAELAAMSPRQLFDEAVQLKGNGYFDVKGRFMASEQALETLNERESDPELTWKEGVVAAAIREQMEEPEEYERVVKTLAILGFARTAGTMHVFEDGDPRKPYYRGNPSRLPEASEAGAFFRSLSEHVGPLAEVILKHDQQSFASFATEAVSEIVRKEELEGMKGRRAERLPAPAAAAGWLAPAVADKDEAVQQQQSALATEKEGSLPEELLVPASLRPLYLNTNAFTGEEERLKRMGQFGWMRKLKFARHLAARGLVLGGTGDAVRILEEWGRCEFLEWIGTDAAIEALKRIGNLGAKQAVERLEAKRKREAEKTTPAGGTEQPAAEERAGAPLGS